MNVKKILAHMIYTVFIVVVLYLDYLVFISGHNGLGFTILILLALGAFIYAWKGAYAYRYLFPSLLGFGIFVVLPLGYTIYIAFTNYSAVNFLTFREVQESFLRETKVDVNQNYPFQLYQLPSDDNQYQISLSTDLMDESTTSHVEVTYITQPFTMPKGKAITVMAQPEGPDFSMPNTEALPLRDVIKYRDALKDVRISIDDIEVSMISLRAYAPQVRVWELDAETHSISNLLTGAVVVPDMDAGFYKDENGTEVGPGFRAYIGWHNFSQIATNKAIRGPFMVVFVWTIVFALFSVLLTFLVGFLLAVLLEWKALRGRKVWRSLIILPYAVPAFISILIFKGLFNPQFGEINMILSGLFGIRPEWTTNPNLARAMVLIVNVWLGYPYMMILCTGILQSVPSDIYEASSIDGGTPFSDLFKMTLPMILPPLKPLLIASFAFNFNNFLLIQLLTNGAPQIVGAATSVGYTDILVTYTFNLAFRDSGANFGFASAIAAIIFIIVSVLSYVNLKMATRGDEQRV